LAKAIFFPSGDQEGSRQPSALGSESGPPQAVLGWMFPVVASRVRRDLRESTTVRGSDGVDAVLAPVVAERLAEDELAVGRRAPAGVEARRILSVHVAKRSVVRVDDPRAAARERTAGGDVGAVRERAHRPLAFTIRSPAGNQRASLREVRPP